MDISRSIFESRISAGATEKLLCSAKFDADIFSWSYDMEGYAKNCVERYCELANKTPQQLFKVATPCLQDHQFKEEELGSVGELTKVRSQIVLKCVYLARIGRPYILWSVNELARAVTKRTRACDKRLARLISFFTTQANLTNIVMWETLHNSAGWDCFRTLILPEILKAENRLQGELCAYLAATRLFPQVGCVRNKLQFRTVQQNQKSFLWMTHQSNQEQGDPYKFSTRKKIHGMIDDPDNVDFTSSNVHSSRKEALLYIFEDNGAVTKMIIKGRSPTMRHVSRTHRVALS